LLRCLRTDDATGATVGVVRVAVVTPRAVLADLAVCIPGANADVGRDVADDEEEEGDNAGAHHLSGR